MNQKNYYPAIRIVSALSLATGLLCVFGWIFKIAFFESIVYGLSTMKFNTAFCLILSSLSLLCLTVNNKTNSILSKIAASLAIMLAGATLLQDLFSIDIHIDEFFMQDIASRLSGKVHPGRMAPTSSLCFILSSIALLLIDSKKSASRIIASYIFHFVSVIAFIAIIGYIYNIPVFYKLSFFSSMAVHTALCLFLLSAVASLLNPSEGIAGLFTGRGIGNVMARRFFPLASLIILILGFLRIKSNELQLVNVEFGIALFAISFLLVCLVLIATTARHLNHIDLERSKAEQALILLNKTLEDKVEERTKDLTASEGKFFRVFQMSPAGLIISDRDTGRFMEVNQSLLHLTGYSFEEMKGKTSAELGILRPEERQRLVQTLDQYGFIRNAETIYYTKNNEAKHALISVEPITIGTRTIALTVLYDITSLKESEKALQEAKQIAEESVHAKERFMANMSHEIRTPMNAIIGFANLFEKTALSEEQNQYLKFIKNSGENLLVLINDILDYSKIEAGMMHLEKTPFQINELLHSLEVMFGEKIREKKLKFCMEVDPQIPQVLIGDPTRLTQIFINLISNAIKFTREGGVKLKVNLVSVKNNVALINILIKDSGIGIPEDKQQEVFERFMQANNETTRHYGGTGLGLSIVKNLVELKNGAIHMSSQPGEGTEFHIKIPYEIGVAEKNTETEIPDSAAEIKKFDREVKALLVEDNPVNQVLAKKVLTRFGCTVDLAENGGIAVEMAASKQYDIVLMDIQMPVMDGYTASKIMRGELHLTLPIIAMTAHIMAGEREKCISNGMTDYISKPFKTEALFMLMKKYL